MQTASDDFVCVYVLLTGQNFYSPNLSRERRWWFKQPRYCTVRWFRRSQPVGLWIRYLIAQSALRRARGGLRCRFFGRYDHYCSWMSARRRDQWMLIQVITFGGPLGSRGCTLPSNREHRRAWVGVNAKRFARECWRHRVRWGIPCAWLCNRC